jgi:hypothetical protein
MPAEDQRCSECGSLMDFRLGLYECQQCGHTEEPPPPEPEPERTRHGPGFRREPWQRPGAPGGAAEAPPSRAAPPGTFYSYAPAPGATLHDPSQPALAPASEYPTLQIEKHIFFGLQVLGVLGSLVLVVLGATLDPYGFQRTDQYMMMVQVFWSALASVFIYWLALYGRLLWVKYCCCAFMAFVITCGIVGFMMVLGVIGQLPLGYDLTAGFLGGALGISLTVLQLAYLMWFVWILWRDIQVLQGKQRVG